MTSPGRRDNGLSALEWGALVDVDPRLSEPLLDALATAGVPAYVEPASDVDHYTRATTLPGRPLDRLWVDPTHADVARALLTGELLRLTGDAPDLVRPVPQGAATRVLPPPSLPASKPTDDEVFAQLVAELDVPSWPEEEPEPPVRRGPVLRRQADPVPEPDDGPLPAWLEPAALEDDGGYEPPPPPRIPRIRLRTAAGVLLIVLGILITFAPNVIGMTGTVLDSLLGTLLMVGGGALLVGGMRDARDHGPDDGAVV